MKGYLNTNQIDYVIFHLNLVIEVSEEILEKFSFHKKCTKEFTEANMEMIKELREWLLLQIR